MTSPRKVPCVASRWHAMHEEGKPCGECPPPSCPPESVTCVVGPDPDNDEPFDDMASYMTAWGLWP